MHSLFRPLCLAVFLCCGSAAMADSTNPDCAKPEANLTHVEEGDVRQVVQGAINADAFAKAQNVNPSDKQGLVDSEAVADYIITIYIRARESLHATQLANSDSYSLVRVLSAPDIFQTFKRGVVSLNPHSAAARLGRGGTRIVSVNAIKYLDRHILSPTKETRRYTANAVVDEQGGKPTETPNMLITIEIEFTAPPNQAVDRCLNPLGARVLSYTVNNAP